MSTGLLAVHFYPQHMPRLQSHGHTSHKSVLWPGHLCKVAGVLGMHVHVRTMHAAGQKAHCPIFSTVQEQRAFPNRLVHTCRQLV